MRQSGDKTRQAGAKTGLLFPVKAEEDIKEGGAGNDQWTGRFFRRALTPESRVAVTRDLVYVPGGTSRLRFRLPALRQACTPRGGRGFRSYIIVRPAYLAITHTPGTMPEKRIKLFPLFRRECPAYVVAWLPLVSWLVSDRLPVQGLKK